MEVPDILCDDSNSLSNSILSTHHVSNHFTLNKLTQHCSFIVQSTYNHDCIAFCLLKYLSIINLTIKLSIYKFQVQAPLYCEDTSNSQSNDAPTSSQSTFSRHRSWMDPCQSSQSSFSISIPKHKKKKKKHRDFNGKSREDSNKIAAKVCSKKQNSGEVGRSKYLSSEVTPDEVKQSSKRRKFSRKNSVLDTPLKKQVRPRLALLEVCMNTIRLSI